MKRFSLTYTRSYPPIQHPEGDWVRYQDAKEQQTRITELEQWIAAATKDDMPVPDWLKSSARSLLDSGQ